MIDCNRTPTLPELLAPAGSPEALEAAFLAGADAVYLGGSRFNARMNAHNFDAPQLREAVTHAHRMGGRVYLTLNTLVWDRELPLALEAAYEAASAGVDALIVADVGVAALIHQALPTLPLHASTQLSGHNAAVGQVLAPFGFSRFVIARETSFGDLATAVRSSPLEVEVFIHGALCVSHSGQCLFSSVVGGRSGNRGECAQPCRLPYACPQGRPEPRGAKKGERRPPAEKYPLSLKDLSLAAHVPTLIEAGVSSLKIEGRMKSPGYVGGVTAIWRRLLDEKRAATREEMEALQDLFSRGGFTDGYQTGRITPAMMGIRSADDKERTAAAEKAALTAKFPPRLPLTLTLTARANTPVTLTAEAPLYRWGEGRQVTATVTGEIPVSAENQPLTVETAEKQLSRTGGTPYCTRSVETHLDEGLMVPLSRLNALRREALEGLDQIRLGEMPAFGGETAPLSPSTVAAELLADSLGGVKPVPSPSAPVPTARFVEPAQITPRAAEYFREIYLPLGKSHPSFVPPDRRGALLPPVIFDSEAAAVAEVLAEALEGGIRHLLVGNPGHLPLLWETAQGCGVARDTLILHGDFRLNAANILAVARYRSLGVSDIILSPELTLPRMRDLGESLAELGCPHATAAVVYGRLPLMLLEKCAIREVYGHMKPDAVCREICAGGRAVMRDRMGKEFPILREDSPAGRGHRNVVYNALPVGMSDRGEELTRAGLFRRHFLFSVETPDEVDRVITAYAQGRPLGCEVRRMGR